MIELKQVTKRYGAVEAVVDLSFRAPRGQIIGLLGQNGAGKTTTLNILTGYLPPTSGQVLVDGMDMLTQARECKRRIGYLPEKPPLYDEMTVKAFLHFVCELKEMRRRDIPAHVRSIIATCGLNSVSGWLIGHLSKGYRQRVGIAQALCGDPPVLVLDEPTVGLDPKQVAEIRQLIRELGKKHTIIFSSHLLSEIQQLCQRVIILHQGRMIREAAMNDLTAADGLRLRASIVKAQQTLLPALRSLDCVQRVRILPTSTGKVTDVELECCPNGQPAPQEQLFNLLCALDAPLLSLTRVQNSLEEAFLRLTTDDVPS